MTSHTTTVRYRLSPGSVAAAAIALAAGIVSGGVSYAARSHAPVRHFNGTAAWWPHLVLTAVAAGWLASAVLIRRRRGQVLPPLLLTPLSTRAASRLRQTARTAPARLVAIVPLLVFLAYNLWRTGEQILGGLDPHFTADAWGGPSYLGAMYCHYLDGGLIIAATTLIIDRLLKKDAQ